LSNYRTLSSINGTVKFNCPSVERGTAFENIELKVKDGRVVRGTCNNNAALNSILDTGGGEIFIDGECIRKNGFFIARELSDLNPAPEK